MGDEQKKWGAREKRVHYSAVAAGEKPVKEGSKFSEAEQRAYARGQRDARNESARITAYKNSTELERAAYAAARLERKAAYLRERGNVPKK
jgi:hypothetical protein